MDVIRNGSKVITGRIVTTGPGSRCVVQSNVGLFSLSLSSSRMANGNIMIMTDDSFRALQISIASDRPNSRLSTVNSMQWEIICQAVGRIREVIQHNQPISIRINR